MSSRSYRWVVLSSWISKIVTAGMQIAIIRLMIERAGVNVYAGVVLLTALAGWYALADIGIGNSLQNYISENRAKGVASDNLICTAMLLSVLILLPLSVFQYFTSTWLGPLLLKSVLGLSDEVRITSFLIFGQLSLIGALGVIVSKILYATHRGYIANAFPAFGAVASYIIVQHLSDVGSSKILLWYILAIAGPNALLPLPYALNLAFSSWKRGGRINPKSIFKLSRLSVRFSIFAVMSALTLQVDYVVISQLLSASDIVAYNVTMKIFSTAFFVYYSVLLASWPLFTEHIARTEWAILRSRVRNILLRGLLFMMLFTAGFLLFNRQIVLIVAPSKSLVIAAPLILLAGLYFLVRIWTDTFSTVLCSMSSVGLLVRWVPVQAFLSLGLQVYLTPRLGASGTIIALIFSFLLTVAWVLPRKVSKVCSAPLAR